MDLLNMLLGSMASEESVGALAEKTGTSTDQASKLVASSIPVLLGSMTNNAASSKDGAQSLLGALSQHTNTGNVAKQIGDADEEDGGKILHHILGEDSQNVVDAIAEQTDMSQDQVTRGLANMAPALLSMLSAATNSAAKVDLSDGLDLSDLLGLFGGSQQTATNSLGLLGSLLGSGNQSSGLASLLGGGSHQSSGLASLMGMLGGSSQQSSGGLLGSLLGGSQPQSSGGLLGSLFGSQPQQQSSGLGGILGSLLGGSQPQQATSAFDGSALLGILSGLMK